MNRYNVSIQTNEDGHSLSSFNTKKEALRWASYWRTGGMSNRGEYRADESPMVCVYDNKEQKEVYCQPMFKKSLKN